MEQHKITGVVNSGELTPYKVNENTNTIANNDSIQELIAEALANECHLEDLNKETEHSITTDLNDSKTSLFEIHKANDVIKMALSQPDPVQLYPVLILENEFTIVFADTGVGKTVFSFQMAIHIANLGYTVLYMDLELSKKQFQKRYTSEDGKPYNLPDNLYRVNFARLNKVPKGVSYIDYFFDSMIDLIKKTGAKVIFLDNLTKLAAGDTDSAKAAIPILERLNELKESEGLTIIVLEHNKKVDTSRPIELNDLQGSKMKSNLVDAVFSIGRSAKDKNLRYIKQVKVRDGETIYDTENVKVCELSKVNGFLSFTDVGFEDEREHLRQFSESEKGELVANIKDMLEKDPTLNAYKIAKKLCPAEGNLNSFKVKVSRIVSKLNNSSNK